MNSDNAITLKAHRMVFDIGGSLIKLAFIENWEKNNGNDDFLSLLANIAEESGKSIALKSTDDDHDNRLVFHLFKMNRSTVKRLIESIGLYSCRIFNKETDTIALCGNGHSLFKADLESILHGKIKDIQVSPSEFLLSYAGIKIMNSFTIGSENPIKFYTYSNSAIEKSAFPLSTMLPIETIDKRYILVLVGTATSIILVDGNHVKYLEHSNISGSTYLGLCKLICNYKTFKEATKASEKGCNRNLDFTMSDLLSASNRSMEEFDSEMKTSNVRTNQDIAPDTEFCISSFGKYDQDLGKAARTDVANAILKMVTNSFTLNTFQKAKAYDCKQVVYTGSFFDGNPYAAYVTSKLLRYLSNNRIEAVFTDQCAFVNCIGSFYDFEISKTNFDSLM
jgi:pantothenate kinase